MFKKKEKICPFSLRSINMSKYDASKVDLNDNFKCRYKNNGCYVSECKYKYPEEELGKSEFMPVVIVGARGSGKSHFIAVLIREINALFNKKYGIESSACGDGQTRSRYERVYFHPLYGDVNIHKCIDPTRQGDVTLGKPMLFHFKTKGSINGKKNLVIGFYDVAGEDFSIARNEIDLLNTYPILKKANNFILMLDSTQIPKVRNILSAQNVDRNFLNMGDKNTQASDVLESLSRVLEDRKKEISVAVCFSKSDAICGYPEMPENDSPIYKEELGHRELDKDNVKKAKMNAEAFESIDGEVKAWINAMGDDRIVRLANSSFKNMHCFFSISALGINNLKSGGSLRSSPRPIRVLDPILWLFWQHGWIDGFNER